MGEPVDTAIITPSAGVIVAMAVSLLLHVPPLMSNRVEEVPGQIEKTPVMAGGAKFTVTGSRAGQPLAI